MFTEVEDWSTLNKENFFPVFIQPSPFPPFRWLLSQNGNRTPHHLPAAERGSLPAAAGWSKGLGGEPRKCWACARVSITVFSWPQGQQTVAASKCLQCHLPASCKRSIFVIYRSVKKRGVVRGTGITEQPAGRRDSEREIERSLTDLLWTDCWRCWILSTEVKGNVIFPGWSWLLLTAPQVNCSELEDAGSQNWHCSLSFVAPD